MPIDQDIRAKLKLQDLGTEQIFSMSKARMRELFGFKNGELNTSVLIKNLIWQDKLLLEQGLVEPFEGNIRTYWYERVKPVLARARARKFAHKYDLMISNFSLMVAQYGLFRYRDFGFVDSDKHLRHIGAYNPHVVCVAEKMGHMPLLEQFAQDFGCSTIALGGQPSLLGTEYLVEQLRLAGLEQHKMLMVTLVDFDPSGDSIANSLIEQMRAVGYQGQVERIDLVHPKNMTAKQIRLGRFPLSRTNRQKKKNERWVERTGGGLQPYGHGKYQGLEVEAMTPRQITDLFTNVTSDRLWLSTGQIRRRRIKRELADTLKEMLLQRIFS